MNINSLKIRQCLQNLNSFKKDDPAIIKFLLVQNYDDKIVENIFTFLSEKILNFEYTECISLCFAEFLLLIVSQCCKLEQENDSDLENYQRKSYVLSQLSKRSSDILRYAVRYFKNKPPPFQNPSSSEHCKKKLKISNESKITDLIVIKTCHNLLSCDPTYFKNLWDWSDFIENYHLKGSDLQKMYCNHIIAFLLNMTISQLNELNKSIPDQVKVKFDSEVNDKLSCLNKSILKPNDDYEGVKKNGKNIEWNFHNDLFINVESVILSVYNSENAKFYKQTDGHYDRIVKVESTKNNLRNIALGTLSGKAVCLCGPVGCGKTTLIEYLARKTGRICPKESEIEKYKKGNDERLNVFQNGVSAKTSTKASKRKSLSTTKKVEEKSLNGNLDDKKHEIIGEKNGFLRIQLGDQTDSKMILGQYRCTDVPGEFVWLPGVLTQAVMNGYWLLLEDLDCATQETCVILSNLLENKFLSVPGFRDHIKIEPGFQLSFTIRTNQLSNCTQKASYSLLEKHLYTVNILSLSKLELCEIISNNYPKLSTISNRIVDVFLTFSNTTHTSKQNDINLKKDYIPLPHENVSIANLPNSGRMVSTRDLMKLCERSNPMFSVTSTECAYFVFQNAVDVFCSYLPQSKEKTKLITSIGAKLGIIQSRCEFYSEEYKPDIKIDDDVKLKVGRATLTVRSRTDHDDEDRINKKIRLSDANEKSLTRKIKINNTFSFTRISSCLLERISVSIMQNEPILLVGETGVGKTSAIQYVAERTEHKLVVVNMNNQSDISDLIGGFKPVDLGYIITPIRCEFEHLFRKTFNEIKNEKFLSNISICYNQGNFSVLIKLMLRIIETVFQNIKEKKNSVKIKDDDLERWKSLNVKLLKLNAQLKKSINISFAFIAGSLVNCIKNGDWVLLDEINLASAETLECLSTILEPDGSIVLLERGDLTPIKRHRNFRIFACMNPSTDIGKKDLPTGIRNRFTEFFVDELITENDLILLVNDYLSNTGIKKTKVLIVVKLYKKLKSLSQLELNDGLGNRPVFSLRTLCRALRICAKNLCGSVERNLYESFCLSFLTQLDPNSHKIVLNLIKDALLTDVKAVLSQSIPRPGENFINFESYWIQKGPKELKECDFYILTDSVRQNLKDLCRIISIGKLPVLLQGPTSAGKTSLIEYVAKCSGNYCLRINNHEHTDLQEYIGTYTSDTSGKLTFKEGVLVQAMRNGFWIILDELNLASTDILEALNRVLDDNRELYIPEIQTLVKAHPNFMLFATQNPPGLYGGRKTLSRAFKNRFIELHFNEIPKLELEIILEKRCLIPKSYSQKMVNCMSDLQMNRKTTTKNNFTLRDLFRWGNRYTYADKSLLENNSYDWNQHLVDEGYLVLSSKVRTDIELEIIEETLYKNFRKHINTNSLYTLHENTSMVTRNILESLHNYKIRSDIIWTQNMTRMAVLTAKAIQFNEPVLLVGPTGCGKTTICQILANINCTNLRILNCHMHTEGADFLGGLRPCRKNQSSSDQNNDKIKLFEWVDGPLVLCMKEGNFFMADEISLAEDSVLERLNSVLEPEKTILLAEKSDISTSNIVTDTLSKLTSEFVIKAESGFQFLATMNPGGDFGKKELSPALRNRFTEIWCKPSESKEDLIRIAENFLKIGLKDKPDEEIHNIATVLIDIVFFIKTNVEKFKFSVRDILSWTDYISITLKNPHMNLPEVIILGLETLFLDSLEMIPHETLENVEKIRQKVMEFSIYKLMATLKYNLTVDEIISKRKIFLKKYPTINFESTENCHLDFLFNVPTTQKNLFRLLSAMNLNKAILLEGPPGVGKTSIIENLCKTIGYKIVRINLCEHTDLADLFGTDLPAEEDTLEINTMTQKNNQTDNIAKNNNLGKFTWRDGPLLAALKSDNTWILLDELNLAPQNVLEGLNAILDHRGEVFIPELNKTFILNKNTRIFGCQNPLKQGGGRKGLPQSFLNRFIKVYLRKLNTNDLLFVIKKKYSKYFNDIENYFLMHFKYLKHETKNSINLFDFYLEINSFNEIKKNNEMECVNEIKFDLIERMVKFSEILDQGIANLEFGYKGGPFEINLRDILRWCNLLINENTGFVIKRENYLTESICKISTIQKIYDEFMLVLYERMKLVYYQRMRSENDRIFIRNTFANVFNCDAEKLNEISQDTLLYWTDNKLYLNDIAIDREILESTEINNKIKIPHKFPIKKNSYPLMLSSQRELLKNMIECLYMEIPIILCGPTDTGKTKSVDILCTITNQIYETDTIDDSVTGGFQQIDLNRHLEEASNAVESVLTLVNQNLIIELNHRKTHDFNTVTVLFSSWKKYSDLIKTTYDAQNLTAMSDELILFKKRLNSLCSIIEKLLSLKETEDYKIYLLNIQKVLINLDLIVKNSETLNTGGNFEWIDSKFVKCLKFGKYICLEHVNLCSAAILDRLNSVFEPNGCLLISEKGVTKRNNDYDGTYETSEVISKHKNFRAFLTIDPKNGELSRAMRNRCVEISLLNNCYTTDDLKLMVYENGIQSSRLINVVLSTYEKMQKISDLSAFNVSHLIHFASLISAYKRIGYDDQKAIYNSGIEVYINSSRTDLLGFGLDFYHAKLKDILKEEIDFYSKTKNDENDKYDGLKNIVIKCGNLDTIAMIKLQCEPFIVVLKYFNNHNLLKTQLNCLFSNFENLDYEIDIQLTRFMVYMLYELSTIDDLQLRNMYLNECISKMITIKEHEIKELCNLNNLFMNLIVNNSKDLIPKSYNKNLPWNQKLFHRIRDYKRQSSKFEPKNDYENELNFSAILISYLIIDKIQKHKIDKLNKITIIAYSQAINANLIGDNLNNKFIQEISIFFDNIHLSTVNSLKYCNKFENITDYIEFIIKLLWINRFYAYTKNFAFKDKKLNKNLFDKLLLHYKWIEKYFLHIIQNDCDNENFIICLRNIRKYITENTQPLNIMKKLYYKSFVNFLPFYSLNQIKLLELKIKFDKLVSIVPEYGGINRINLLKKFNFLLNENSQEIKEKILYQLEIENLNRTRNIVFPAIDTTNISNGNELEMILNECQTNINESGKLEICDNFDEIENTLCDFEKILYSEEIEENENSDVSKLNSPNEIILNMIPFLEYYVMKSIRIPYNNYEFLNETSINLGYFEDVSTLNCSIMETVKLFDTKEYKNFQKLWNFILSSVITSGDVKDFKNFLNNFPISCYKNLSTFIRSIYSAIQKYNLRNLSLRSDLCNELKNCKQKEFKSDNDYNGSPLINSLIFILYQNDGQLKEIPLNDINLWKKTITRIQDIIWNNSHVIGEKFLNGKLDLNCSINLSSKLLLEVKYIQELDKNVNDEYFASYKIGFNKLIEKLEIENHKIIQMTTNLEFEKTDSSTNMNNWKITYHSSMLHTLIGAIELCLLNYSPIVDPVEKNQLKNNYIQEDLKYLKKFKTIYDFMRITMNYKNFGCEIYNEICNKINYIENHAKKFQHKIALRPLNHEDSNLFGNLMQEIQHFCNVNCEPNALLGLITSAEKFLQYGFKINDNSALDVNEMENILIKMADVIRKINLWISNSQKFLQFTLDKYKVFYNDFVKPIECSCVMLQYGLENLKTCLIQIKNSYYMTQNNQMKNFHENDKLNSIIKNIGQFPNVYELQIFSNSSHSNFSENTSCVFTALNGIDECEVLYFQLMKAKLIEIKNRLNIFNKLNSQIFYEFDSILNICNKIWQNEEEKRRKRLAEEESLYTYKTRNETENDEEIELREIQENFPTYVQEDFSEFIIEDNLEKSVKISNKNDKDKKQKSKHMNLIKDSDYKFFGKNFIEIMENFSSCYYYNPKKVENSSENNQNFVEIFKLKSSAFIKLFNKYKSCMSDECLDEIMYNNFLLAVGLQQSILTKDSILDLNSQSYNFYKDANVKEIISITEIMDKLEERVIKQLNLYPDHAVLNDIICVINRIRKFSFTSPITRFNTGFQLLRQKVSQWNEFAHKLNHLKDLENQIAECVQRWTKLELQCWRNCLTQTYEKVESNAYKYWFFIYNLLHEFIYKNNIDSSYVDFKKTEKKFEDENYYDDNSNTSTVTTNIKIQDIINVIRQFIESSNYADFNTRMKLIKSFELYLHNIELKDNSKKEILIAILHNIRIYFEQFSQEIEVINKSIRLPIEKKLRDFVKIESYNKDLSYFSMRSNVAKVHRNLNKFLKEYENLLKEKIIKVFQQKDNLDNEYVVLSADKDKNVKNEMKIKYYMINTKNFIVSQKPSIESDDNLNNDGMIDAKPQLLLTRIWKLYSISRNIVRKILTKVNYSKMIFSLDSLLTEQIETCSYLRKLEIDRTQERRKQVSQAKQILSQKRKSLSDLFKILSNLGINFKSGLMELTLMLEKNDTEPEKTTTFDFVNYEIEPFDIKTMFVDTKYHCMKFDKTFQYLYENLNSYYGKCIFKLKLLQNQMLIPKSELGPQNIERIKGCAIDMYILVQNQRKTLSRSAKELYNLKNLLNEIKELQACVTQSNFENDHLNFNRINIKLTNLKQRFYKISYVLEQFNLLLENVPDEQISNNSNNHIFTRKNEEMFFTKCDEKFNSICTEADHLNKLVRNNLSELLKLDDRSFLNFESIDEFEKLELNVIEKIEKLKNKFKIHNHENYHLPIVKPLTELIDYLNQERRDEDKLYNQIEFENCGNIDNELENIVNSILMSLQKLYKKYYNNKTENNKENDEEFEEIHENHLKQKISNELESDLEILNCSNIYRKIHNIVLTIKYIEKMENKSDRIKKLMKILPLFEQYCAVGDYYLFQQLSSHKISAKMLSIMLTVFIELNNKGFCIPPDLMQDVEEENEKSKENGEKGSEGFGLEDGTGENDVSDKIESEDQLDDAKRPEDRKNDGTQDKSNENCKEEKGIEMSEDFDAKMQDIEKPDDDDDSESDKNDEEEDLDKEMGETEEGAEKLDDQIWGSDEENENSDDDNENEMNEEEDGEGCKDEGDQHNDLDTKNDTKQGEDNKDDGLDATNDKEQKNKKNDIDSLQESELDEDQINPYHNELEDPPEPEDMDLSDNFNIDEENKDKDDETDKNDNPFDIDTMKENMEIPENESENENQDNDENQKDDSVTENDMSDSETEPEAGTKPKDNEENANSDEEQNKENDDEKQNEVTNEADEVMNENEKESEENKTQENDENEYNESKDNPTKDDKTQAIPEEKQKGSLDQVQTNDQMDVEQDDEINEQDTGEEKEGIGQAENDTSESGHQGIADTEQTRVDKSHQEKINNKQKRKQGKTEEERTLGDADKNQVKQLKTIEKLKEQKENEENEDKENEMDTDEYQHVREPKKSDKLTLDNATEEQSKQIQHLDDEKENENEENDEIDQLESDNEEVEENDGTEIENMTPEKIEKKSEKASKSEKTNEKCETTEQMEIEGDTIETSTVFRGDETSAHCNKNVILNQNHSEELSASESLELRKMYQTQVFQQKSILPHSHDFDTWNLISNKMLPNARELCEQLRLILEPTKCTKLKGDYRTGRRINMKKIIPYIASQFRKDKIWLRRTKPAQRDYKITIAIDDSKSMHHNNSKSLTLEAISLVSQALTLLESGKLSIVSFGESPNIVLNHTEQFDGPKLVTSLNFSQNQSRIAELLDFVRTINTEEGSSTSNGLFENLLLILSDGRNIYSEGEQKVKNSVKLARLQRIFLVYIIIDNPENKHSILDIRIPEFSSDRRSITMKSYLDVFPFPYYVIVRDLNQLPLVLSEAMRQWFELVNSEQ